MLMYANRGQHCIIILASEKANDNFIGLDNKIEANEEILKHYISRICMAFLKFTYIFM